MSSAFACVRLSNTNTQNSTKQSEVDPTKRAYTAVYWFHYCSTPIH